MWFLNQLLHKNEQKREIDVRRGQRKAEILARLRYGINIFLRNVSAPLFLSELRTKLQ